MEEKKYKKNIEEKKVKGGRLGRKQNARGENEE